VKLLLPNLITTLNLFFGFYAILQTLEHQFLSACWAIILGGFCDMADGQVARMTNSTSQFGLQYDSFSDLISFGLAPALLIYSFLLSSFGVKGILISFAFVFAGAFRLARFNITSSHKESIGLPITIAGICIATYGIFLKMTQYPLSPRLALYGTLFLALCMVSKIEFMSSKQMAKTKQGRLFLLVSLTVLISLMLFQPEGLFFFFASYILANLFLLLFNRLKHLRI
jgi:CDP-diacylglycerol--serine O-phosphatidyltransferase